MMKPRILFVGEAISSHAQNWIELLRGSDFDVLVLTFPPGPGAGFAWPVVNPVPLAGNRLRRMVQARWRSYRHVTNDDIMYAELCRLVREWRPHIIHSFGLYPSAQLVSRYRRDHPGKPTWVMQLRGGSDLELTRFDRDAMAKAVSIIAQADHIVSDNIRNFQYLKAENVDPAKFSSISPVSGAGGVDLNALARNRRPLAQRRTILWPKAYNTPYCQAFPVIEALKIAWPHLPPCTVKLLWTVQPEVRDWLATLPAEIRGSLDIHGRISHDEALACFADARAMLAVSLVDGVPNVLYEAMASGVIPIVSPIDTIADVVREGENVLFARNLYPDEIAASLIRAMTDDSLGEAIIANNFIAVDRLASRDRIRAKLIDFYRGIA